jgi:hypothetical protein
MYSWSLLGNFDVNLWFVSRNLNVDLGSWFLSALSDEVEWLLTVSDPSSTLSAPGELRTVW